MATEMTLNVNDMARTVTVDDPQMPLLYALRNDLGLHGPRDICGLDLQAKSVLDANKRPTEEQIKQALAHNLCRCGTHVRIVRAVKRAAAELRLKREIGPTRYWQH